MKRYVGISLVALGVILVIYGINGIGHYTRGPQTVTIADIEGGKRPDSGVEEWWRVTGVVPLYDKKVGPFTPYASSSRASWDDIRLLVRLAKRVTTKEEARARVEEHRREPVGTMRLGKGSGLPDELLAKSPGIEERVIILRAGAKPTTALVSLIAGPLLLIGGVLLIRKAKQARETLVADG